MPVEKSVGGKGKRQVLNRWLTELKAPPSFRAKMTETDLRHFAVNREVRWGGKIPDLKFDSRFFKPLVGVKFSLEKPLEKNFVWGQIPAIDLVRVG